MQQQDSIRTSQASISAALAAANAALRDIPSMNLARPDSGRSLAEMAQRDLDAALQLLTDRAQYITGSSGAAIALRRNGTNDMLCRASTGSNAPELGTLLSTEFGLSGESVRTRRALRCDDAERDARVNRDVCREVGIASVVVMPVVHDDEVLGVFELFSGKAHAFGERDMSALQRLSEMVETAVRLAQAAQSIPERLKVTDAPAADSVENADSDILEAQNDSHDLVIEEPIVEVEAAPSAQEVALEPEAAKAAAVAASAETARIRIESPVPTPVNLPSVELSQPAPRNVATASPASLIPQANPAPVSAVPMKKPLLWSAAANPSVDALTSTNADQSHVPPAFRNLRKCEACGFPVSAERTLCVECEEKKWRGQLKPRAAAVPSTSGTAAAVAPAPTPSAPTFSSPEVRKDIPADVRKALSIAAGVVQAAPAPTPAKEQKTETKEVAVLPKSQIFQESSSQSQTTQGTTSEAETSNTLAPAQAPTVASPAASPTLVFSAALEPSQSWLGRNKYVLGAMLAVAGTVAAILLLR